MSVYDIIGWLGAGLVVGAYAWVTKRGTSVIYHAANIAGAAGLMVNALYHHALPSTAVNVVWAIIAFVGIGTSTRRSQAARR